MKTALIIGCSKKGTGKLSLDKGTNGRRQFGVELLRLLLISKVKLVF